MADFGHDLSCTSDLAESMLEVDGWTTLAQALYRRLTTPRGRLLDDPSYGMDLTALVDDGLTSGDLRRIGSQIDGELLKDERVLASSSVCTFLSGVLTVTATVSTALGPFRLVLAATSVSVPLLQVSR